MVDRAALVARDHHDALLHAFVVERARGGVDADLGPRHFLADRFRDLRLQGVDPVEWQRAADGDGDFDEQLVADRPHPHAVNGNHAGHAVGDAAHGSGRARRYIRKSPRPEPPPSRPIGSRARPR